MNEQNDLGFDSHVKDQISKLKQEIEALEEEIKPKNKRIGENRKKIELLQSYLSTSATVKIPSSRFIRTRRPVPLAELAVTILQEKHKPMHYTELMKEIEERWNMKIPGNDPKANMTAHLYNDPRIMRYRRGVYGLKEWKAEGPEHEVPEPSE